MPDLRPNAILTGSRVYGSPKPNSDVDLVLLMTGPQANALAVFADQDPGPKHSQSASGFSLRFGRLNLIIETDPVKFEVWVRGTEQLTAMKPVTRSQAVALLDFLQRQAMLSPESPPPPASPTNVRGIDIE